VKTATFDTTQVTGVRRGAGAADMVRNAAQAVRTWNKRRVAIRELYSLSDRQLADIGVLRGDIPAIVDKLLK
jgi:uncharacterized protein YjiS (DUF1127 family)